jgi:anti-sigma regulatory factor (Ser/Thr protein kinase)/GAF domain-containing protein
VKSSNAVGEDRRRGGSTPILGADLAASLHCALREALYGLDAVTAIVHLLNEDRTELRAAMLVGTAPSLFTVPARMALDGPYAAARALAAGGTAVVLDPDPRSRNDRDAPPYPYVAVAVPVATANHRFGALTVLRLETRGRCEAADCVRLEDIGAGLAVALAGLAEGGAVIEAGHMPVLVYAVGADAAASPPDWGVPGVPGSAGVSLMYPLRQLADMLNQATTMDQVVRAARFCLMTPFRADALVLASAGEGRLWVLGHSGTSSGIVRTLHGSELYERTPAADAAVRGRPRFIPGNGPHAAGPDGAGDGSGTDVYLPLIAGGNVIGIHREWRKEAVGVCCLSFTGNRRFLPEERVVLTMMAGLLGAAVERVELSRRQHALAECIQRRLLPPTLSELPRLTSTARYRPATATSGVGGDWYDVIVLPHDRVVLVVGDVEGHAIESAALMGQVRSAVVAYATEGHPPAVVVDRTSRLLAELRAELLVTCCVVALDTADGMAEVALAGHPAPLVRGSDGGVGILEAPANVPMGVAQPWPYRAREHTLEPGALLMLYSNGLLDRCASDLEAAAAELLGSGGSEAGADLEQLADRLIGDVRDPLQRRDDAVLLLARWEGCEGGNVPRTAQLHIQRRDLRGVGTAREFVDDRLRSWGLAEMSDDLQLIVSEIVTNALIHAGSEVDVRLRGFADRVRLEVRDSDSNPPVPSPVSLTEEGNARAEHGRGLFIVEALASAWDSSPNGRGKTVWLDVPIPGIEAARGPEPVEAAGGA